MNARIIAFDADDTLWPNEMHYRKAAEKFNKLLEGYRQSDRAGKALSETEIRNIDWYGYGIKSYTLSMIEAAITLTDGQISGVEIQRILDLGQDMLGADVHPFEGAAEILSSLNGTHELMLITKGDLLEQGKKVARSGLAGFFRFVEILAEKTPASYQALLDRYGIPPEQFLMVGNSLRSDILPVLAIGGQAVYIPAATTWTHEHVDEGDLERGAFHELEHLGQLPDLIARLNR